MRCGGGDIDEHARFLLSENRQGVLGGKHHAAQVDGHDAIKSFDGNFGYLGIATGDTDTDIAVHNVESATGFYTRLDCSFDILLGGDIGSKRISVAISIANGGYGLFRRLEVTIDGEHRCAFARKHNGGRTAISDASAGCLTGAKNQSDFVLEPHERISPVNFNRRASVNDDRKITSASQQLGGGGVNGLEELGFVVTRGDTMTEG